MKKLLLLTLLCPVFSAAFAQKKVEYLPGYYLNASQDTIRAEIYFLDWAISPSSIRIRTPEKQERQLEAHEIRGFGIQSEKIKADYLTLRQELRYISQPDIPVAAGKSPYDETETISFFAQWMVRANAASLLLMTDKYNKQRFFLEKKGQITELEYFSYVIQKPNSSLFRYEYDHYKSQLQELLDEVPSLRITNVKYTESDLKKLIIAYNTVLRSGTITAGKTEGTQKKLLVGVGYEKTWNLYRDEKPLVFKPRVDIGMRFHFPNNFYNSYSEISYNVLALSHTYNLAKFRGLNLAYGGYFKSRSLMQAGYAIGVNDGTNLFAGTGVAYGKKILFDFRYGIYPIRGTLNFLLRYAAF